MVGELVAVAVVTGLFSVGGQVFIARDANKTHDAVIDEKLSTYGTRFDRLEEKVTKHNDFMSRLALGEQALRQLAVTVEEIRVDHKECLARRAYDNQSK